MKEPIKSRLPVDNKWRFTEKRLTKKTNPKGNSANIYISQKETKEMASLGQDS